MRQWTFVSRDGTRSQGVFNRLHEAESAQHDPEFRQDLIAYLGPRYSLRSRDLDLPQITPDCAEHFNASIGVPVRSRRHLRDLQLRSQDTSRPFTDYQPVRSPSEMRQAAAQAAGVREEAARRRAEAARLPAPSEREWEPA